MDQRKIAAVFVDGQSLYHSVREAFGHRQPNFDVAALSRAVADDLGLRIGQINFYTGLHSERENEMWASYWQYKLAIMGRTGVKITTRPLAYATVPGRDGQPFRVPREKGIDVRIALDMVKETSRRSFDDLIVMTEDFDIAGEAIRGAYEVAKEQGRSITGHLAFPAGTEHKLSRMRHVKLHAFSRETYDRCIDPNDYMGRYHDMVRERDRVRERNALQRDGRSTLAEALHRTELERGHELAGVGMELER